MSKNPLRSSTVRVLAVLGAVAALPVSAASAAGASSKGSILEETTSILLTGKGTSVLGIPVPVLGTDEWTITLPVGSEVLPQFVWEGLDFTVTSELTVGDLQIYHLYLDPRMC